MKLFFLDGLKNGDEFELKPPGISIGREVDNDIVLEEDGSSRYHAKVEWRNNNWLLKDLGSTNGTKVNGEKITGEKQLSPGDRVRIGKQDILFAENKDQLGSSSKTTEQPVAPSPKSASSASSVTPPPSPAHKGSPMSDTIDEAKVSAEKDDDGQASGAAAFMNFFEKKEDQGQAGDGFSLFGKKSAKEKNKTGKTASTSARKHASLLFYIAVIGIAVIVVSLFIINEKRRGTKEESQAAAAPKKASPILVIYEKQESSDNNIFHYRLEIRNDTIRVEKDDLQNNIRFSRESKISDAQLEELEHSLRQTDFMTLSKQQAGISSGEVDRQRKLTVAYGKELNSITIRNTFAPTAFEETVSIVEDFSRITLNIPAEYLTAEEMKKEGLDAYYKAGDFYRNHEAAPENLRQAIKLYEYAVDMLEHFEPKPPEFENAFKNKREAEILLEDQKREHKRNAIRALQLDDLTSAREEYRELLSKLDPDDNEYQKIRGILISIDSKLRKKK